MESLNVLIDRATKRMKIIPVCHHDGTTMMFRRSSIDGGGIGGSSKGTPIRDDQTWKCPTCYHTEHFGIPMTRQEALEEIKLRKGRFILFPTLRQDERDRQDIKERLRRLGYIDFDIKE